MTANANSLKEEQMRIYVHSQGIILSSEERSYIEERFALVLRRFQRRIRRVLISVRDVNGPKGGHDKLGHATIVLNSGWTRTVRAKRSELPELVSDLTKAVRAAIRSNVVRLRQRPPRLIRKRPQVTRALP